MRFSVLINDNLVGFFTSSHGLRQGDPLSLLPYVIVMEMLSRMVSTMVGNGFMAGLVTQIEALLTFLICCLHMTL